MQLTISQQAPPMVCCCCFAEAGQPHEVKRNQHIYKKTKKQKCANTTTQKGSLRLGCWQCGIMNLRGANAMQAVQWSPRGLRSGNSLMMWHPPQFMMPHCQHFRTLFFNAASVSHSPWLCRQQDGMGLQPGRTGLETKG